MRLERGGNFFQNAVAVTIIGIENRHGITRRKRDTFVHGVVMTLIFF